MFFPYGLDAWEIVVRSFLYACCAVSFGTTLGATIALLATREPKAAAVPATARKAAPAPVAQPVFTAAPAH